MNVPTDYGDLTARVAAMAVALDERDHSTQEHCDRVCGLAVEVGMQCAFSARELRLLRLASAFHDVGKIGIPDDVLRKRAELTEQDWTIMKSHSAKSERIVSAAGFDEGGTVALAVRHHHERFDGLGYPDGLAGEAVPVLARVVAIADAYDAMARQRHYGAARTHPHIMDELRREQGRQHDPYVFAKFAAIIERSGLKAPNR